MNNTKFSTFRQFLASFVFLTAGAALAAFALEEFLVPATILDGGIVGVSMIVSQLTPIALGVLTFVLNIPFLIIGTKNMGLRFLVSAGYSMTLFSVLLSVFAGLKPATSEPLLAVVFGGVLLGAGVGLVLGGAAVWMGRRRWRCSSAARPTSPSVRSSFPSTSSSTRSRSALWLGSSAVLPADLLHHL